MVRKPRKPIIDTEHYHTAGFIDVVWLKAVGFNTSANVQATQIASDKLESLGIDYFDECRMSGGGREDRLKKRPASKVLVMSYFNAIVSNDPAKYPPNSQVKQCMDTWARSLEGKAKEIVDRVSTIQADIQLDKYKVHAVVRPTELKLLHFRDLEPWYLVAQEIARQVGYHRVDKNNEFSGTSLRERMLMPLVFLGFCLLLVVQLLWVVLTFRITKAKLRERWVANRNNWEEWLTGNLMAYSGLTQWQNGNVSYLPATDIYSYHPHEDMDLIATGLLCLGCVVIRNYFDINAVNNPNPLTSTPFVSVLYDDASTRFFMVGKPANVSAMKLSAVKYDAAGGRISSSALSLVVVWVYIVGVLALSVVVCTENWGGRSAWFERISDAVWVATTGLVSVFGLLKLASEDPNAIRHALSGRTVLTTARDIFLYLDPECIPPGMHWETYLKVCAASLPMPCEWAKDEQTSYLLDQVDGNIRIADGVTDRDLAHAMIFADENSFYRSTAPGQACKVQHVVNDIYYVTEQRLPTRPVKTSHSNLVFR